MDASRLAELTARFASLRVLVVGDFFLDKYLILERAQSEISIETGLEAYQVTAVRTSPGAAGTVVANLRALGANVKVLGAIGDTGEGYELQRDFAMMDVDQSLLIVRPDLFTPTYTKPMMVEPDGTVHELNRLDIKNRTPLPAEEEALLIARLRHAAPEADAVIISEYVQAANCGAITDRMRAEVAALGRAYPDKVITADSRTRIGLYRHVIIKSNLAEAWRTFHDEEPPDSAPIEELARAGQEMARRNAKPVFITLGPEGMLVCTADHSTHVPTVRETGPIDTVGAGDSSLAGLTLALAAGATLEEAALVGNLAAAVTIRKLGTTGTANPAELLERFAHLNS